VCVPLPTTFTHFVPPINILEYKKIAKVPYQWGVGAIVCVSRSENFFLYTLTTLQAISNH